jgi:SAM-dependent methyltransferase
MTLKQFLFNQATLIGLRFFATRAWGGFSYYIDRFASNDCSIPETYFLADDGRQIPIYGDYRYSVKLGWTYFRGLCILSNLSARGKTDPDETSFCKKAIGTRTLGASLAEINNIASQAAQRNKNLFLQDTEDADGLPEFQPDEAKTRSAIDVYRRRHAAMFRKLSAAGAYNVTAGASILEIGYISGGHSIQAFEQLGFRASGIDNYYSGLADRTYLHQYIKELTRSQAHYFHGDITCATELPSESFDVIYSVSVLEHIRDLEAAFAEMYRLLKPGGVVIHNYAPYFSHDGGHALGIGDSPWAHVRLSETEYLRYLTELRPFEAEAAVDWMKGALHRNIPQWRMQRIVALAGFRLALWTAKPSPRRYMADLSPQIINECFANTPDIGIEDLVSQSISFVATK